MAIVTGGAQGLGAAIVSMLCANGAKVMVFDMNVTGIQATDNLSVCRVDVADESSVVSGVQKTVQLWGQVDIMVNCAGIVGPHGVTTDTVDVAGFDKVYEGVSNV